MVNQTTVRDILTRSQWLRMLAQHRQGIWLGPHVRERRHQQRVGLHGTVTLQFKPIPGSDHTVTLKNCAILDACQGGLSIRVYHKIAPDTPVSLELWLGGKHYPLAGRVAQSSGFTGSIRVGIALEFAPARAEAPISVV